MKRIILLITALLIVSSYTSAFAIQMKSADYIVVPEEQVKETVQFNQNVQNNTKTQDIVSSKYNVVGDIGQYIKIKNQNKYGVVDSNGNIVLAPVFQRIDIINIDGQECFAAKTDGKYRYYYNTGKLIPEDKIYSVVQNTSLLQAKDLKPLFLAAIVNKDVLYTKNSDVKKDNGYVYEIKEIPVVKDKIVQSANLKNQANQVIKSSDLQSVIDNDLNIFTVGKKQFYIINDGKKIGIANQKGDVIVQPKYDVFYLKKPCKHFKNPVFVVSANNLYSIFDLSGKLLAEQIFDRINVYRNGQIYTYNVENGKGVLRKNDNVLGYFTLSDKGYKYSSKSKLALIKPHIVNNLILTLLNI